MAFHNGSQYHHVELPMFQAKYTEIPNSAKAPSFRFQVPNNGASLNVYVSVGPPPRKLVLWPHVLNRGGAIQAPTFSKNACLFLFFLLFLFIPFLSISSPPPRFSFGFNQLAEPRFLVRVFAVCPSCCSSRLSSLFWPCRSLAQLLKRCVRFGIPVEPRDNECSWKKDGNNRNRPFNTNAAAQF